MFTYRKLTTMFTSFIVIFSLTFSAFQPASVSAQDGDGIKREINAESGRVSFIGPESGRVLSSLRALGTSIRPQDPALALVKRFGPEFGLRDADSELSEMKASHPEDGHVTVRYQQNYQGIPVMGGELIVNTNQNGDLYSINGEVSPNLSLQTQPTINSAQASDSALQAMAKWYQKTPADFVASEPELWIFDESLLQPSTRPVELVWHMDVTSADNSIAVRELVLVNAQRGGISLHFNQIDTAWTSHATGKVSLAQDTPRTETPAVTETPTPTETPIPIETSLPTEPPAYFEALASESDVSALAVTLYVKASGGNNANTCLTVALACATINGAIGKATAGDTIRVTTGTFTGTGTEVVLIDKSITLSGGWNTGFTSQTGLSTIDGQASRRGINTGSVTVIIERFRIQNGYSGLQGGGGIFNNAGTITINNTDISGNTAGDSCCSGGNGGGGIMNFGGTIILNTSTVRNNTIVGYFYGGGILNYGTMIINNSTVSGNTSSMGIYNASGTITVNNSTVSGNTVGGIYNGTSATLYNSIVAGNAGTDCSGSANSGGYNLIGNNNGCTFGATTGDLVGTNANPINPRLTPLQNNGGTTFTHALMVGSPAINAGSLAAPGSGGNACFATDQRGTARPVGGRCDIGAYEGSVPFVPTPLINTYTANGTSSLPGSLLCNQSQPNCTNGSNPHADAAHKYAIGTYNLYATQLLRDSIDNNGMVITSTVHYSSNFDNAYWSGAQMIYGDAHGYPLADDVVAHELTHGVTQYESNLFYYYQSGAINESFSDVFGEYYDQTNGLGNDTAGVKWLLGEDTSGLGALRSLSNPPAFNDPDKMTSSLYIKDASDSGGVHTNSGINNKAAYLMVVGGTFNGKTVAALGWDKTAAIYYETNTNLLSSGADYSDLYYALQQACTNLIGQKGVIAGDCAKVKDAVDAVEMNLQPVANFNTDAPFCSNGFIPNNTFYDDLESGASNWTIVNGGTTRWQYDSPYGTYAHSGTHFLYADDYPATVTNAYVKLKAITIPANRYLYFAHAYDFEKYTTDPSFYDGGVLEYTTNGGTTWVDAGSLIEYNGYKGIISSSWGNPLKGRNAFVGSSHGYISTRLSLSSLAGKSVSFRWRMGLDSGGSSWGWWLDDVRVYECIKVRPYVVSSVRASANPTNASSVDFTVTFSDSVSGVDVNDFTLTKSLGITGESVTSVIPVSGAVYTVSASTGSGDGTLRLDVVDDDSIVDGADNKLGGTGINNGGFISGEVYKVHKSGADTGGVFRPSTATFYLRNANSAGAANITKKFGKAGDYPVVGDWDGDGTDTIGLYRNGIFYLSNSNTTPNVALTFAFGTAGDQPIAGDWNGDGKDTIGVYRSSKITFLLRNTNSAGAADATFKLGVPGDVGLAGDWNGDGMDTTGVFRPSNGALYFKNANSTGYADIVTVYGIKNDKPVTGDWDGDGDATIGIYRSAKFYLRNTNTRGYADFSFIFGAIGDMPLAGNWDGVP